MPELDRAGGGVAGEMRARNGPKMTSNLCPRTDVRPTPGAGNQPERRHLAETVLVVVPSSRGPGTPSDRTHQSVLKLAIHTDGPRRTPSRKMREHRSWPATRTAGPAAAAAAGNGGTMLTVAATYMTSLTNAFAMYERSMARVV